MGRTDRDREVKKLIAEAIAPLMARIGQLETENAALKAELARLQKNSCNSSKPPSSDIVKPPPPPLADGGNKRQIGGQPGHVKHQRQPFTPEVIDRVIRHEKQDPGVLEPLDQWAVLQQIELAECPCVIREHRARRYRDPASGRIVPAAWPPEVESAGLLGPRLTALVAYLKSVCHALFSTIRKFFRDVLGVTTSRGQLRSPRPPLRSVSVGATPCRASIIPAEEQRLFMAYSIAGLSVRMWVNPFSLC